MRDGWVGERGSHLPLSVADANKIDGTSAVAQNSSRSPRVERCQATHAGPTLTLQGWSSSYLPPLQKKHQHLEGCLGGLRFCIQAAQGGRRLPLRSNC